jgi:molecular chaperone IbpA
MFTSLGYSIPRAADFAADFNDIVSTVFGSKTGGEASFPFSNCWLINDDEIHIQLTVAGYAEDDLTVELENNQLVIKGRATNTPIPDDAKVLWKNISQRSFVRKYKFPVNATIESANLENGMLEVVIKREPVETTRIKIQKK